MNEARILEIARKVVALSIDACSQDGMTNPGEHAFVLCTAAISTIEALEAKTGEQKHAKRLIARLIIQEMEKHTREDTHH